MKKLILGAVLLFVAYQSFQLLKRPKQDTTSAEANLPKVAVIQKTNPKIQIPTARIPATAQPDAAVTKVDAPKKVSFPKDIEIAGRQSRPLAELPNGDQQWVLQETSTALSVGLIKPDEVAAYIDQLSSFRGHSVRERQEPFGKPEEPEGSGDAL